MPWRFRWGGLNEEQMLLFNPDYYIFRKSILSLLYEIQQDLYKIIELIMIEGMDI